MIIKVGLVVLLHVSIMAILHPFVVSITMFWLEIVVILLLFVLGFMIMMAIIILGVEKLRVK